MKKKENRKEDKGGKDKGLIRKKGERTIKTK